jgi:hypothetical protein
MIFLMCHANRFKNRTCSNPSIGNISRRYVIFKSSGVSVCRCPSLSKKSADTKISLTSPHTRPHSWQALPQLILAHRIKIQAPSAPPVPPSQTHSHPNRRPCLDQSIFQNINAVNSRPRRIVTPPTPPSRIIVLDKTPKIVMGISLGHAIRNDCKSSTSAGLNKTSAFPPARNHPTAQAAHPQCTDHEQGGENLFLFLNYSSSILSSSLRGASGDAAIQNLSFLNYRDRQRAQSYIFFLCFSLRTL